MKYISYIIVVLFFYSCKTYQTNDYTNKQFKYYYGGLIHSGITFFNDSTFDYYDEPFKYSQGKWIIKNNKLILESFPFNKSKYYKTLDKKFQTYIKINQETKLESKKYIIINNKKYYKNSYKQSIN